MAKSIFWTSVGVLVYTYVGYSLLLRLLATLAPRREEANASLLPVDSIPVSVVVATYNEERVIQGRIENLLDLQYPRDNLEIIVASDGSTDRTNEIARRYEPQGVILLELRRMGKGPAQNLAVACARGEIIVLTDADTEFDRNFLNVAVRYFLESSQVGALAANLQWRLSATASAQFRGLSWEMETDLREMESRLGILASASGAAMAFRRALWKPMLDSLDDSDSLTPLDVILQGYRVVFARDALAYDVPFASAGSDFKSKVRGVSKSVVTIPRRWKLRQWAVHPLITWRTISHHVLRWVAPFSMVAAFLSSLCLVQRSALYQWIFFLEFLLILLMSVGYIGERMRKRFSIASMLFSFAVINAGFALGLLKGMAGAVQGEYETE